MFRRSYQRLVHPQTFPQTLQLTDGSTIQIRAMSPKRPFIVMPIDSLNHPSWHQGRRSGERVHVDNLGRLAQFKAKFGELDDVLEWGAEHVTLKPLQGKKSGKSVGKEEKGKKK